MVREAKAVTAKEAASLCRMHVATVYRLVRDRAVRSQRNPGARALVLVERCELPGVGELWRMLRR